MTAKLTYSKVAELVQNLVKKGVNIHHPLIADEGAKVIEEYAEQQAIDFLKWMERTNTINNSGVPPHVLFKMYKNQNKEVQNDKRRAI